MCLVVSFELTTLLTHSIGYGDICPGENLTPVGKAFIVVLAFGGLGMFCGPIVELGGAWRTRVPGGMLVLTTITIFIGMLIFSSIEGISSLDAIYFSVITGKHYECVVQQEVKTCHELIDGRLVVWQEPPSATATLLQLPTLVDLP